MTLILNIKVKKSDLEELTWATDHHLCQTAELIKINLILLPSSIGHQQIIKESQGI